MRAGISFLIFLFTAWQINATAQPVIPPAVSSGIHAPRISEIERSNPERDGVQGLMPKLEPLPESGVSLPPGARPPKEKGEPAGARGRERRDRPARGAEENR